MRGRDLDTRAILEFALKLADRADEISMAGFFSHFDVSHKPDGTPVTDVDRRVELALRDMIEDEHPSMGILGEEFGMKPGLGRWVIDPIDGTIPFIEGDPRFASLVAFETEETALVGVVSAPALGLRWWAGLGLGASQSREGVVTAARVSIVSDTPDARALIPDSLWDQDDRASAASTPLLGVVQHLAGTGVAMAGMRSSWEAVRVATGAYDIAITSGSWWDVAPLPIIVSEAGGAASTTSVDGTYDALFSNSRLARDVHGLRVLI